MMASPLDRRWWYTRREVIYGKMIYSLHGWDSCWRETILLHLHSTTHKKASCFARAKEFSRKMNIALLFYPFPTLEHLNGCLSTCLEITCLIKLWELFRLKIRSSHYWVCNQILDLLALRRFWGSHQASQHISQPQKLWSTGRPKHPPSLLCPQADSCFPSPDALKCRDKSNSVAK